jgi:hypothetical protein
MECPLRIKKREGGKTQTIEQEKIREGNMVLGKYKNNLQAKFAQPFKIRVAQFMLQLFCVYESS